MSQAPREIPARRNDGEPAETLDEMMQTPASDSPEAVAAALRAFEWRILVVRRLGLVIGVLVGSGGAAATPFLLGTFWRFGIGIIIVSGFVFVCGIQLVHWIAARVVSWRVPIWAVTIARHHRIDPMHLLKQEPTSLSI